jgi:PilZ domain
MGQAPSIVPPQSESEPFEEYRREARRARFYAAWLDAGAGAPLQEVTVADISSGGARLMLATAGTPDAFTLILSRDGAVRRACKVMWRRGAEVGVKFADTADDAAVLPEDCNWAVPASDD